MHKTPAKKLICIDFDDTITSCNLNKLLHNQGITPERVATRAKEKHPQLSPEAGKTTLLAERYLPRVFKTQFGDNKEYNPALFIRNKEKLCETLKALLAMDGVSVAITSLNDYPELIPIMLKEVGLDEQEIKQIIYHPHERTAMQKAVSVLGNLLSSKSSRTEMTIEGAIAAKERLIKKSMKTADINDISAVLVVDDNASILTGLQALNYKTSYAPNEKSPYTNKNTDSYLEDMLAFARSQDIPPPTHAPKVSLATTKPSIVR